MDIIVSFEQHKSKHNELHNYTFIVAKTSRLFSMYTSESLDWLETEPITMNNHQFGVEPEVNLILLFI